MTLQLAAFHTPAQAWHVFDHHAIVLLLMPVVGAFIGWITKVLAIEMIFRPLEFKGIGPIGWQGQLPRRAAKFSSHATEVILERLLDPREMIDRLDPARMAAELDDVIVHTVDDVGRDLLGPRWDQLPRRARDAIKARARAQAPIVGRHLMDQAKANITELFDLSFIMTSNLIRDKVVLNQLVRETTGAEMGFMKRFGLVFGGVVGAVQMVVYAFTQNELLIPLFGLGVGLVSDWFALQMIFTPRAPKRYFGLVSWHGLFFKNRNQFAADYARLGAEKVLTPQLIMESLLNGPLADRLFAMLSHEINDAIDAELGVVEPLVPAAIGSNRYKALRDTVIDRAQAQIPEASEFLEGYAREAIAVEETARTALEGMTDDEYEGMVRPIFKEDEWLVVALGGGLGFVVGELQVHLLTLVGGLH